MNLQVLWVDRHVEDLMHEVVATCRPSDTLRAAAAVLAAESCGILVALGREGVAGILSERDIIRAVGEGEDVEDIRVREVMTEQVVTVDRHATVQLALEVLDEHQIRHLVVTDKDVPIGVVSQRDLVHAMV